ncbi:hypothetical protein [Micromonospora sp. RTGN7]|uniref:hypothetical protein n=1 Tax=Micromonospora sp. RTGN7 TaxID=3016526 RepID=UPI0029FF2E5A|nr:hypothetical protein [Micromonospora sp. RTGN7]
MEESRIAQFGTEEEFQQALVELVNDFAPRRFAICEEHGDRVDGEVFAWGLAFGDGALLCDDARSLTGRFRDAGSAMRLFARTGRRLRLIWVDE